MTQKQITTYYLEMTDKSQLRPKTPHIDGFQVTRCLLPLPELNRFLYEQVGKQWQWFKKLEWTAEQWQTYVAREVLQTWIGYWHGTPVGYFELEQQAEQRVELAYFGLLPSFIGQGLGGLLLTAAIRQAWEMDAQCVWVHTCTLDHPSALANYQARGFRLQYTEVRKMINS